MSKYDIERIRNQMKKNQAGRFRDPLEFRPPKVEAGKTLKFKFFVLPPLRKGDKVVSGQCSQSMEEYFCVKTGGHFINNELLTCPRILNNEECDLCTYAFELMNETDDKEKRKKIAKDFLPRTTHMMNLYFLPSVPNPQDLQGKVLYFNAPGQAYEPMEACINRDNAGGDSDNPQPFGVFFDETASFPYQLEIGHKGGYNDYTKSTLLYGGGARPIAASDAEIRAILDCRIDLFSKIPEPNTAKIASIVNKLKSFSGFDVTEPKDDTPVEPASRSEPESRIENKSIANERPYEEKPKSSVVVESHSSDDGGDDDEVDPEIQALLKKVAKK